MVDGAHLDEIFKLPKAIPALDRQKGVSWDSGIGTAIEAGKEDFTSLEKYALSQPDPVQYTSGRQELFENIVNELI